MSELSTTPTTKSSAYMFVTVWAKALLLHHQDAYHSVPYTGHNTKGTTCDVEDPGKRHSQSTTSHTQTDVGME